MSTPPPTIEYATPILAPLPSNLSYSIAIYSAAIAACVAILCLLGFAVTGSPFFAFVGYAWLPLGGLISLIGFCFGVSYFRRARAATFQMPHSRARAKRAIWFPLTNVPLALVSIAVAIGLIQWRSHLFTFRLENLSTMPITNVTAVFNDGSTQSLGSIEPDGLVTTRVRNPTSFPLIYLEVTRGGMKWRQLAVHPESYSHDIAIKLDPSIRD